MENTLDDCCAFIFGRQEMKRSPLKRKTPLRKMSKKRQKESKVYSVKRREFLAEHPICQICESRPATEIHHKESRYSDTYLNEETWLALCGFGAPANGCHAWIHRNPGLAREMGYLNSHTVSPGLKP